VARLANAVCLIVVVPADGCEGRSPDGCAKLSSINQKQKNMTLLLD